MKRNKVTKVVIKRIGKRILIQTARETGGNIINRNMLGKENNKFISKFDR